MRFRAAFLTFLFLLNSMTAVAKKSAPAERKVPADLYDSAYSESAPAPASKADPGSKGANRASDAQIQQNSGLLSLKDPGVARTEPEFKWLLGARAQTLAPRGTAVMDNGQTLNLDGVGSTAYPLVELGVQRAVYETESATFNATVRAEGGYISQSSDVTFQATGVKAKSSYLSTNILGLAAIGSARLARLPHWEFEFGWNEGQVTYTQNGSNSATFSESARYGGPMLGVVGWVSNDWALSLEDEQRNRRSASPVGLQSDNLSLGVRALW